MLLSDILRYFEAILNCFFCAISLCEFSVCAIFYTFSNYVSKLPPLHTPCKYKQWIFFCENQNVKAIYVQLTYLTVSKIMS